MACTKVLAPPFIKETITWTRFYLPKEQEWPAWPVNYNRIYLGPLAEVDGCRWPVFLGRIIDRLKEAAIIISKCYLPIFILSWITL